MAADSATATATREQQRTRLKQLVRQNFTTLLHSKSAQKLIDTLKLNQVQFQLANQSHLAQLSDLMNKSYVDSNPLRMLLDKAPPIDDLKDGIECGFCLIALKNSQIIASMCMNDYFDSIFYNSTTIDNRSSKKHFLISETIYNSDTNNQILNACAKRLNVKTIKYGNVAFAHSYFKRKDSDYNQNMQNAAAVSFLPIFASKLLHDFLDYKLIIGVTTSKMVDTQYITGMNAIAIKKLDYSDPNFMLTSGVRMKYYFDRLKVKKNWTEQQLRKWAEKNCHMTVAMWNPCVIMDKTNKLSKL